MKSRKIFPGVVIGVFLYAVFMLTAQATANPPSMKGYCVQPPFLVVPKQPNVLVILDSSGSMNCLAYQSEYDPTQFTSGQYYGYFDPAQNYKYTTSATPTAANPNRWIPTTDAMNTGTAANPIASGNFLNWITMSRQDVAKKILIGGRAATGISSPGAYNACNRSTVSTATCLSGPYPSSVKLYGNSDATTGLTCATNVKTYDNTSSTLIYPFTDEYDYTVQTGQANTFTVTYSGPAITPIKLYPTSNYPGSNPVYTFPAAWLRTPSSTTLANAYTLVDETARNTTDYITNKSTKEEALFEFNHADAALLAAAALATPPTISSITVHAYAKKNSTSSAVYLKAVLWGAVAGPDLVQDSGTSALSTSWADKTFNYTVNPTTGLPWQWSDFTSSSGLNRLKAFGVRAVLASNANPTSTKYASVSQVYLQINIATPPDGGPYRIIVDQGTTPARGILDSLSGEVRFGLANYNSSGEGGKIADTGTTTPTYVDFGTVPSIVKTISDTVGSGGTPLAETLFEMVRYFRQDSTYYNSADYKKGCGTATNGTSDCSTGDVNTRDPYFYGGTTNQYVPCTQSYILFLTDGESYGDQSIPGTSTTEPYAACSLTNIKKCSGSGTLPRPTRYGGTTVGQTYPNSGTDYMIDVAYWARTGDMRDGVTSDLPLRWRPGLPRAQNIYLYPVFLFGSGSTLLQDAAIYGGFQDIDNTGKPDCTTKPEKCYRDSNGDGHIYSVRHNFCSNEAPTFSTTCIDDADCGGGTCYEPDAPLTYYEGDDGYRLEASITAALTEILKRSASGTAASVLASGEGSGANLLQAIFYPKRSISGQADITWTSTLQNFWYYINTTTSASSIRENTTDAGSSYELNITSDNIINFFFDTTDQMTKANLFVDANADGVADSVTPTSVVDGSDVKSLWEAGLMLWNTSASNRTIYANVTDTFAATTAAFAGMTEFSTANLGITSTLQGRLNTNVTGRSDTDNNNVAADILNYVRGADLSPRTVTTPAAATISYRNRATGVDLSSPKNGSVTDTVTINGVAISEASKVWKLGDIIDSTPRVVSWIPLNTYHLTYSDKTYNDFVKTSTYKGRGMVFAGANDGMLHAFKLGTLDLHKSGTMVAKLCEDTNANGICETGETTKSNMGKEQWAFIPKSALPYLQYLAKPDYCHLYYVDATPYVFDASIEAPGVHASDYWTQTKTSSSWRTILIGGMRLGGACSGPSYCSATTTICSDDADCAAGVSCVKTANTVGAPAVAVGSDLKGYSSYFALDITDPTAPQLLWEFTNANLGVASSGPAIVKINARDSDGTKSDPDKAKDGKWFVIFASGPTGPVGNSQFKGFSNQNLRLFVLDLKTGSLLRTIDTGIANAFGGSLNNANIDYDFDYQDDAVYMGYTKSEDTTPSDTTRWTRGGVLRLITREDLNGHDVSITATAASNGTALNPANWLVTRVVDNIGPVNSSIVTPGMNFTAPSWCRCSRCASSRSTGLSGSVANPSTSSCCRATPISSDGRLMRAIRRCPSAASTAEPSMGCPSG